jgi:hypothetical protein
MSMPKRGSAGSVSGDLFSDRVLVERQAFMQAQTAALEAERVRLLDEGWKQAVAGRYEDVQDQLRSMDIHFTKAKTPRA